MPRVVFDTGVVVIWVLFPFSIPAQAIETAICTGIVLISDDMQNELVGVLSRPKFKKYAGAHEIKAFIQNFLDNAEYIPVTSVIRACVDPNDDKVLELAVSGRADCIITSDQDLLALHPFRKIEIVTPRMFLDRFGTAV